MAEQLRERPVDDDEEEQAAEDRVREPGALSSRLTSG